MAGVVLYFPYLEHRSGHKRRAVQCLVHLDTFGTAMDERLCLYGIRTHGLQFHDFCEDHGS